MVASSMNRLTYLHCESLNSARQTVLDNVLILLASLFGKHECIGCIDAL